VQEIADPDAGACQPKIGGNGVAQIIPAWIGIEGHRQIHYDPHADSAVGNPYPPLQAFVHQDIRSRAATGMNRGPCPWSVKELPDIIIAVIRRLHCVHFYIKPGPKVQWKNAASPILLAHGVAFRRQIFDVI
jgi:hypothetical protein